MDCLPLLFPSTHLSFFGAACWAHPEGHFDNFFPIDSITQLFGELFFFIPRSWYGRISFAGCLSVLSGEGTVE
jgi:hypothetical protein